MKWTDKIISLFFKKKKKTKIEKWQEYAENLVIESGINLENVLVHNYGSWAKCGLKPHSRKVVHKDSIHGDIEIPIPHPKEPYIAVPEIKELWDFHAWIHEIYHYKLKHYKNITLPVFIQEYEAEKCSIEKCKESGLVDKLDLIYMKYDAVGYVDSHINKAIEKGEIKYIGSIPQEVIDFLYQCDYMREEMKRKNLPHRYLR